MGSVVFALREWYRFLLNHPQACDFCQAWLYAPSAISVDDAPLSTHSLFLCDTFGFPLLLFVASNATNDDVAAVLPDSPGFVQAFSEVVVFVVHTCAHAVEAVWLHSLLRE